MSILIKPTLERTGFSAHPSMFTVSEISAEEAGLADEAFAILCIILCNENRQDRDRLKHLPCLWRDLLLNVIRQGAIFGEGRGVVFFQKRKKRKKKNNNLGITGANKSIFMF